HAANAHPNRTPWPSGQACCVDRVVRLKYGGEMRQVEDLLDRGLRRREAKRTTGALGAGVATYEGANAGTVNRRHPGEIHDEMFVTAAHQLAQLAFECFGCTAREKRLTRRKKQ